MHFSRITHYLWTQWIRPLAIPLLCIAAAKSALADINVVPSGSMHPTLLEGDIVWVNKLAYDLRVPFTFARLAKWDDPHRGDIVVCFQPHDGTRLVKRIVGLPGDTLEMRGDVVFVNGQPLAYEPMPETAGRALTSVEKQEEAFASEQLGTRRHTIEILPARRALRTFSALQIPAGQYFLMGDNRDNSADSRYFGFMPRAKIIGRVPAVVVSADPDRWLMPRFDRIFSRLN
jgi:signal peptidase I